MARPVSPVATVRCVARSAVQSGRATRAAATATPRAARRPPPSRRLRVAPALPPILRPTGRAPAARYCGLLQYRSSEHAIQPCCVRTRETKRSPANAQPFNRHAPSTDGRTGLVTGASAGIGRATARILAGEGVRLAITGRRREKLEELKAEIVAANGPRPAIIVHDAMEDGYPRAVAQLALDALGSVEILVNNAGGSRPFKMDASEEQWNEALTLNFTRHRQLTHGLLDQMIANGWGRIVNITGKSEPEGINGAFCAKAAMHSWAKGLSREVGRHGITVNSFHRPRHQRSDLAQLRPESGSGNRSTRFSRKVWSRRPRVPRCLPGFTACELHHRRGHSGRWRTTPVSVLKSGNLN